MIKKSKINAPQCMIFAFMIAGLAAVNFSEVYAADLADSQKDGICRVSLARINANSAREYTLRKKFKDTYVYQSGAGYTYECEVFSDGMAFTLSNIDWGRLKPTGSVKTDGKCSTIKLFDPGFGKTHDLKSCVK